MMFRLISASPQHGSFAPGFEPPPSDLENLIAGRERELGSQVNQAEFERLIRKRPRKRVAPLRGPF